MTLDQIKQVHEARPFQPFTLRLADGSKIAVRHPEFMARSPTGRTVVVFGSGESFEIVDLLLVAAIDVGNGRGRSRRQGRGK